MDLESEVKSISVSDDSSLIGIGTKNGTLSILKINDNGEQFNTLLEPQIWYQTVISNKGSRMQINCL